MGQTAITLGTRPGLAHLVRATNRYFNRLGNQMAASIAFGTMLAVVPLIMFAFSAFGFTLTVIKPEWRGYLQKLIVDNIHAGPLQDTLLVQISYYLYSWRSVGVIAIVIALVIGSLWVGNLKVTIRAMTRPDFNVYQPPHNVVGEFIINMGLVFVVIIVGLLTLIATTIGTQLASLVIGLFPVDNVQISAGTVRFTSFTVSLLCATGLYYLMYRFFPEVPMRSSALVRGSFGAGIMLVVMQAGAGLLARFFALGKAAQVLGPVIVVMIFMNLIAQMTLFWAGWIATANQPGVAGRYSRSDESLRDSLDTILAADHWTWADQEKDEAENTQGSTGILRGTLASRFSDRGSSEPDSSQHQR